jgi:HopA1 effector protein family
MTNCYDQVMTALRETFFYSPVAFSCFGKEPPRLSPRIQRAMTPQTVRNYILYQLQSHLYNEFYIHDSTSGVGWSNRSGDETAAFVDRLSVANSGLGCWEGGWEVLESDADKTVVRKAGLSLWARRADCMAPSGSAFERDTKVRLRLPKELRSLSPGYYMALSDQGDVSSEVRQIIRIYWNLRAEGAAMFVAASTALLNTAGLFFKLKVLNDPGGYGRCDAGVLYLGKGDYTAATPFLHRVYSQIATHLKGHTPKFTKQLAPGVGLAEDPGQEESFGQNRSRILASGILHAHEQGARSLAERLNIVAGYFSSQGVCLDQPFLNADSADLYEPWPASS